MLADVADAGSQVRFSVDRVGVCQVVIRSRCPAKIQTGKRQFAIIAAENPVQAPSGIYTEPVAPEPLET